MTKAEIVAKIAEKTGVEKGSTQAVVESFMEIVKEAVKNNEDVYLRILLIEFGLRMVKLINTLTRIPLYQMVLCVVDVRLVKIIR